MACKRAHGFLRTLSTIALVVTITGCVGQREAMRNITVSSAADVFQRIEERNDLLPGFAVLYVSTSLKTHRERAFTLDSCRHGKPDFKLVLNIDGQAVALEGEMKEERSRYVGETDPEAGDGFRYDFREVLRLKPGKHTIKIAVPDDGVALAREVTLKEGANQLVLKPQYGKRDREERIGFTGDTTFYEGIKTFRLFLDGKEV